jgi:regulator of protease activity HflC (stomatin/prohibitin superfamily)
MEHNVQRKGLVNWVVLLVLGGVGAAVAAYADSATGLIGAVFMGLGLMVALTAHFQMRLEERERLEGLEYDQLKQSTRDSSLFAEQAADTFPARQARIQFEKYFVPGVAILLLVLQALGAWLLWNVVGSDITPSPRQSTVAMVVFAISFVPYFLIGRFSAVFARIEGLRLLRPQASYLLLGAALSAAVVGIEIATFAGHPEWDRYAARVLVVFLGLVALENLATLVFEIYRPRLHGQQVHPLYESRLIGILSQPGGLVRTAAQALDYQFGFKVSETWFYRFLEKALAWLILAQIVALLAFSSVVVIEVGEKGLLERFGRPVAGHAVLEPGLHFKLPWPLSKVYRYETERVQTFMLGMIEGEQHQEERTMLWTKAHAEQEFNMLVASRSDDDTGLGDNTSANQTVPVNMLSVKVPVHFEIRDLEQYAYSSVDAGKVLRDLANAELTRYLASVDLDEVMTTGRRQAADALQEAIQKKADQHGLGVGILFVGLAGIHPPVKVAPDFEAVMGALQSAEATNLIARAYAAGVVPTAKADATNLVNQAESDRLRLVSLAAARAGRFTNQLAAHEASPQVYRELTRLATLSRSLTNSRKYVVVPTNAHQVITLNLEDSIRPDLTDMMLPSDEN